MQVAPHLRTLASSALFMLAVGCQNKDAAKCSQAQQTVRQALSLKDMDSATKWREYAYKQCDDQNQLGQLDKEIVDTRNAIESAAREQAQKKAEQQQLLGLFKDWVGQSRNNPERSVSNVNCEGGDDATLKVSKERFCSGTRAITGLAGTTFVARYWEKTPAEVALFSVRLPLPATCADLGGHAVRKVSDVPATQGRSVKRYYCDLNDGALAGMQALVTEANSAEMRVFSAKYPDQDPALRFQLK